MNAAQFFKTSGRLSLGKFWLHAMVVWLVFYGVSDLVSSHAGGGVTWLINGTTLLVLVFLCIRRLHDRNHSGWWLFMVFVPVLGAIWLIWQCALRRGLQQDNRWGEDLLQSRSDYLVVR